MLRISQPLPEANPPYIYKTSKPNQERSATTMKTKFAMLALLVLAACGTANGFVDGTGAVVQGVAQDLNAAGERLR